MPDLKLEDGITIHWDEVGAGPPVVIAIQFFGMASVFHRLIDDLAVDHRVITYDLRGTGQSSRVGPYDFETDSRDLEQLLETLDQPAVIVGIGDGCNRAIKVAARRPDLMRAVISPAGNPAGRQAAIGTDALAGSESVLEAFAGMMSTDYRGALRAMFRAANPEVDEEQLRERVTETVEYCPNEPASERLKAWIADDSLEQSLELGDRLWLLEHGHNPWFPISVAMRTRELLPDAHIEHVDDGVISRPDITAATVRGLTRPAPAAASERSD